MFTNMMYPFIIYDNNYSVCNTVSTTTTTTTTTATIPSIIFNIFHTFYSYQSRRCRTQRSSSRKKMSTTDGSEKKKEPRVYIFQSRDYLSLYRAAFNEANKDGEKKKKKETRIKDKIIIYHTLFTRRPARVCLIVRYRTVIYSLYTAYGRFPVLLKRHPPRYEFRNNNTVINPR